MKLGSIEVRPHGIGDVDFGIGHLPKQEVADAHFATGPNQQIRIANAVGVKMALKNRLVNVVEFKLT